MSYKSERKIIKESVKRLAFHEGPSKFSFWLMSLLLFSNKSFRPCSVISYSLFLQYPILPLLYYHIFKNSRLITDEKMNYHENYITQNWKKNYTKNKW